MRIWLPDTVRRLPLDHPDLAVQEYAGIIRQLRDGPSGAADLEAIATEAVETAVREGAVMLAVVAPPDAAPALLTGVPLDVPDSWDTGSIEDLRDSVDDVGGPDVRETIVLETGVGPAVVAQRVPGREQALAKRPLTLQLQAFIPEPGSGQLLLLTLASPSAEGWQVHQRMFGQMVLSAEFDDADQQPGGSPADPEPAGPDATAGRAARRRRPAPVEYQVDEEESFEQHTYRVQ